MGKQTEVTFKKEVEQLWQQTEELIKVVQKNNKSAMPNMRMSIGYRYQTNTSFVIELLEDSSKYHDWNIRFEIVLNPNTTKGTVLVRQLEEAEIPMTGVSLKRLIQTITILFKLEEKVYDQEKEMTDLLNQEKQKLETIVTS